MAHFENFSLELSDVRIRDQENYGWCTFKATAFLLSYELKFNNPKLKHFEASTQDLIDNFYIKYPDNVTYKKTDRENSKGKNRVHVKCQKEEMDFYTISIEKGLKDLFKFLQSDGVCLERRLKYVKRVQKDKRPIPGERIKIDKVTYVAHNPSASDVKKILMKGHPIMAVMYAPDEFEEHHGEEVYNTGPGLDMDCVHMVAVTGVGFDGVVYYDIVNSWGSSWGNGGRCKVARDLVWLLAYIDGVHLEVFSVDENKKKVVAKNKLLTYADKLKGHFGEHASHLDTDEKKRFTDALEAANQWLEANHQLAKADEFEDKMKELEDICKPLIAKMVEGVYSGFYWPCEYEDEDDLDEDGPVASGSCSGP
ncbi:hypothetical protein ACP275_06G076700 [Erythranthe tilingii]